MLIILCALIFFSIYGLLAFYFMEWLSQRRAAGLADATQFGWVFRILAFVGIFSLAILPPVAEVFSRVLLNVRTYDDLIFIALIFSWVISFVPAIRVSRRTLRAGGIDPDRE